MVCTYGTVIVSIGGLCVIAKQLQYTHMYRVTMVACLDVQNELVLIQRERERE